MVVGYSYSATKSKRQSLHIGPHGTVGPTAVTNGIIGLKIVDPLAESSPLGRGGWECAESAVDDVGEGLVGSKICARGAQPLLSSFFLLTH